jgi:rhodanese-related sulfurtransferase
MVATIDREELKGKIERRDKFILAEILPPFQYEAAHLPGAVNVPPGQLRELVPKLLPDKNAEIVVYCGSFT